MEASILSFGLGEWQFEFESNPRNSQHLWLSHKGVSILLGTHNYPHLIRVGSAQNAILLLFGKGGSWRLLCDNPIGEDDTGGSAVWLLYREWPYWRKMTWNPSQNNVKTLGRWQILHEWGVPWSFWLQTWFRWVKKLRWWRLWGPFWAKHVF